MFVLPLLPQLGELLSAPARHMRFFLIILGCYTPVSLMGQLGGEATKNGGTGRVLLSFPRKSELAGKGS